MTVKIQKSKDLGTKVLISIPNKFLALMDASAKEELRSRSEYVREAVRFYERNKNKY